MQRRHYVVCDDARIDPSRMHGCHQTLIAGDWCYDHKDVVDRHGCHFFPEPAGATTAKLPTQGDVSRSVAPQHSVDTMQRGAL